jgi:hypothetical protein
LHKKGDSTKFLSTKVRPPPVLANTHARRAATIILSTTHSSNAETIILNMKHTSHAETEGLPNVFASQRECNFEN